eukprot:TRINITY_DN4425_c1_g1_i1.p3 TRINITY_DN4425_c1_g1~~TRINITY_DN4425_c1_g1_i1.p3  ORF type:complete len:102 (-),score=6.85 TRINITY_DN4425_c1_g1_i1:271-576(-)
MLRLHLRSRIDDLRRDLGHSIFKGYQKIEHGAYVGGVASIILLLWDAWLFRDSFRRRIRNVHEEGSDSGAPHVSTASDKQVASSDDPELQSEDESGSSVSM